MGAKNIYFIEDDKETQFLFKEIFETEDYNVTTFDHGAEALEFLSSHPYPDLLVMDLNFPEMTAEDFIKKFRDGETLTHAPVVVFSGSSNLAERAKALGAVGFLPKPMDLFDALEIVSKTINPS